MSIRHISPLRRRGVAVAARFAAALVVLLTSALVRAEEPAPAVDSSRNDMKARAVHEVSQSNKEFMPAEITVEAGDEVVFLNDDEISHNVFSRSEDEKFNLMIQRPGEHKRHRFETQGQSVVRCAIHPNMKLVVNVLERQEAPPTPPVAAETSDGEGGASTPAASPAEASP